MQHQGRKHFFTRLYSGLALMLCCSLAAGASAHFEKRPDVKRYLDDLNQKYHFKRKQLDKLFSTITLQNKVLKSMEAPAEGIDWGAYRRLFVTPRRIDQGLHYWHSHADLVAHIANDYKLPPSVLLAILGIESNYGQHQTQHKTLDTLATLGFNYPRRSRFFRSELTQLLLLCRENHLDPTHVSGSYAGAVGMPQFMPSSYRRLAVAYHHKGPIDLFRNDADALASIAHYLQHYAWHRGQPAAIQATLLANADEERINNNAVGQQLTQSQLKHYGLRPSKKLPHGSKPRLIALENGDRMEYWLALPNLQTIREYNHSDVYALSVWLLAEQLRYHYHAYPSEHHHYA